MKRLILIGCLITILLLSCDKQGNKTSSLKQNTADSKRELLIKELIRVIKIDPAESMQPGEEKDTTAQFMDQLSAIDILGDMYAREAIPELIELLKQPQHHNYFELHSVIHTLVKLDAKEALLEIVNLLNADNSDSTQDILYAISVLGDEQIIPQLLKLTKKGKWDAANAIIEINGKTAVPELINLLSEKDVNVRQIVASTLGELGDKRAIPALIKLLNDEHYVKEYAVISLAELDAKESIPEIKKLLNDKLDCVRERASDAIKKLSDERPAIKQVEDMPSVEELTELCNKSKLIFTGRIKLLTNTEHGYEVGYQMALYFKECVLKGKWGEMYIPVNHLIAGGKTELHGFLNPAKFYIGAKVIVFAGRGIPGWWPKLEYKENKIEPDEFVIPTTFNENYGVIPYSEKLEEIVRGIIDKSNTINEPK